MSEIAHELPSADADEKDLQRRDDLKFQIGVEDLLREAESSRLAYMQKHRGRKFVATTTSLITVLAGSAGFGWFFFMQSDLTKGLACIIISLALPAWLGLWSRAPIKAYIADHKITFMPHMAKLLGGFRFYPKRGISAKILSKTGVIPAHQDYNAEDCFMGRYKGAKVMFSEATLTSKIKGSPPVFRGLFVLLEVPQKVFSGHTIITADKEMALSYSQTRWQKLSPVQLDSAEDPVHNRFVAYSDHPDDAKLMLGSTLIKELSEAAQIFDGSAITAVLFHQQYVFMMIPHEIDMFEASNIFFPVTTKTHAMTCKKEIEQLLEIVDVFDLYSAKPQDITSNE